MLLVLLFVAAIQIVSPVIGAMLTSLLTTMATIIGFVAVFFEMKRAADIDECKFLCGADENAVQGAESVCENIENRKFILFRA